VTSKLGGRKPGRKKEGPQAKQQEQQDKDPDAGGLYG
jgi:hypothetical protein